MRTYEGMFLVDPALASDFPAAEAEVKRVLDRSGAELIGIAKWDERKLAYPIRDHKRGLYLLSFFKVAPDKIVDVDRDVRLSEKIIRALVLSANDMKPEAIEKALAGTPATGRPVPRRDDDSPAGRPGARPSGDRAGSPAPAAKAAPVPDKPSGSNAAGGPSTTATAAPAAPTAPTAPAATTPTESGEAVKDASGDVKPKADGDQAADDAAKKD